MSMSSSMHNLDPSLRANSLSSPPKPQSKQYHDGAPPQVYSPLQPSPNSSYQGLQTPNYYPTQGQIQESPEEQSPVGASGNDPNDLKRPRACEACRQLKVKCELDDSIPNGSCKRCAKAHRQCIITAPSRKRQKKTDSRVAELEKKIDALTASLAARGQTGPAPGHDPALDPALHDRYQRASTFANSWQNPVPHAMNPRSPPNPPQIAGVKRKEPDYDQFGGVLKPQIQPADSSGRPSNAIYPDPRQRYSSPKPPMPDCIDRNLIDLKTAMRCFDRYHNEMCQQLPIVVFPPDVNAQELRKTKPILFQAVIGVACGAIRPDLQSRLISDTTRSLADRIVYTGEKSMELVQTINVMTVFYQPPEKYEELNFNQLIHIAAVMALDIGMGKRSKPGSLPVWKNIMDKNKAIPDPNAAETRRCWLGCYYMCANSAMSLRRPLLLRWSPYADESMHILRTAPDALPSDRLLAHLVKAQHIGELIGSEFSMDDPATELSLTDQHIQYHLRGLEQELERWKADGADMMSNPIMQHTEAIIKLYMHEIAMHNEHNIDDFRPPYHSTPIEGPRDPESVTPEHIKSLTVCMESAHAAFEAFLAMDITLLRALPTHFFVRNSYAAVALIKLYSAISARGSKYGAIFKPENVKVEYYLDRLISTLMQVAEGGMSKVAYKFSLIFQMLRSWHMKRTESPNGRGSRETSQSRMPANGVVASKPSTHPNPSNNHTNSDIRSSPQAHPLPQPIHAQRQPTKQQPPQPPPPPLPLAQAQPPVWPQATRSGLQMLSEAAHMNPSDPSLSQPPPQQQWPLDPTLMAGSAAYGLPPGVNPAAPGADAQMGLLDFTSDELMAYGFGDEFLAMNFGWEGGGGWAI